MENRLEHEILLQKYLSENRKEDAIDLLFQQITALAKGKNFKAAETLRNQIFEIDPFALNEIIRSAEIIEAEKHDIIDGNHREIWSSLYKNLTVEESNELYFSLKHEVYGPNESVYKQGERKARLYFLNTGSLKIVYFQNGREVLLNKLVPGRIAGEDSFFSSTVCTTSMTTLSKVELSYLDADATTHWESDFPLLESKLLDFISKFPRISELIKNKNLDRRFMQRIQVSGEGTVNLLNSANQPVGKPFKVGVSDVSQGGLCLLIRIVKKKTASVLLGQKVRTNYLHPQMHSAGMLDRTGTIVAVQFYPFGDCSIHLKFDNLLTAGMINEFQWLPTNPQRDRQ